MKRYIVILSFLLAFQKPADAQTAGQKDTVAVHPWSMVKTYDTSTGKFLSVRGEELERHAAGDLRNRLTGMLPGVDVTELGGGIYEAAVSDYSNYHLSGSSNKFHVNGFNNMNLFVDDMPIPFNQLLLDPNQIESVTALTDVLDKAKLGPMASYGALLIRTRKGSYDTPLNVNIYAETGVNIADRVFPWASGADYAALNNKMRLAAGLSPVFSDEAIQAFNDYRENDIEYPCVNYRDKMLRNAFSMTSYGLDASAGSSNIKWHLAVNGLNYGDMLKAEEADYNKINLTGNVTTRIGKYVEAFAGFMGLLSYRRMPNVSWYDYRSVPEVAYPLTLGEVAQSEDLDADLTNNVGKTIYGVSNDFGANYYAKLIEGGTQTVRNRSGMFHANVDIDFGWVLKGLKSKTSILTTSFVQTQIGKTNDYIAYFWDPEIGVGQISPHKGELQTSRSISSKLTNNMLTFHERLYYDLEKDGHRFNAGVCYYQSNSSQSGDTYYQRLQFVEGDASWSYKGRYNVEVSAQYSGSHRFKKGKTRWGFFPSAGVSWIATNESFLEGNAVLTLLKIYAQAGDIGQLDLFSAPYLYSANYSSAASTNIEYGPSVFSGDQWFGTQNMQSTKTDLLRYANSSLTWTRLSQQNVGIDLAFMNCIYLSADWFRWRRYGNMVDALKNIPDVYGITSAIYRNYESSIAEGFNASIGLRKTWGDFALDAWTSASWDDQIYDKLVTDDYSYDYQRLTGTSSYSIRGFECIGRYLDYSEIESLPSYVEKSNLKVGDLKYKDQNEDGVIDENDKVVIGKSNCLSYMVNISASWKNLDVTIIGTGHAGGDFNLAYSTYFTGAEGMANQSQFVIDHVGKTLPRVDYYGVPNNSVTSSYWLRKANWFKFQTVDIGYTIPFKEGNRMGINNIRLDVRGSNLLSLSSFKYMDPEDTSAGLTRYPFFKTITFGVKVRF